MSASVEETNALLTVSDGNGDVPVVRTTVRRVLDFTHRIWTAGFYNKVFKWPNWHWYEGTVRRMAGLGKLPGGKDENKYFHHNLHCDVLIVGAGPAGLAAALSAGNSGARVLLIEQDHELGGSLLANSAVIDAVSSDRWIGRTKSVLEEAANVTVMTSSTVSGYYDHNFITVTDRSTTGVKRFWKVRAKEVVLTTGSIEQPLVFENNDRPGIMLATAAMQYVNRYAVKPGESMLVATNNDSAYETAFAMHDKGVRVPAIVDVRKNIADEIAVEATQRGIAIMSGAVVLNTVGTKRIASVSIGHLSDDGQVNPTGVIACRGLAMSGGFSPNNELYSQAGGKLRYDTELACFVPKECRQRVSVAGAANGQFSLADALELGATRGYEAASRAGFDDINNQSIQPGGQQNHTGR